LVKYFLKNLKLDTSLFPLLIANSACLSLFPNEETLKIKIIYSYRYVSIFLLKNPTAIKDEFWAIFLTILLAGFSIISQFVFVIWPGNKKDFFQQFINFKY